MSGGDGIDEVLRRWGGVPLWTDREPEQQFILRQQREPEPEQPYIDVRDYPGVRYVAPATVDKRRAANRAARKARRRSR